MFIYLITGIGITMMTLIALVLWNAWDLMGRMDHNGDPLE